MSSTYQIVNKYVVNNEWMNEQMLGEKGKHKMLEAIQQEQIFQNLHYHHHRLERNPNWELEKEQLLRVY